MSFDPNSTDAMFAKVLAKLEEINEKTDRIEAQAIKTNGRVNGLERWRDIVTAKTAMIAGGLSTLVAVGFKLFVG